MAVARGRRPRSRSSESSVSPETRQAPAWVGLEEQDEFAKVLYYGDPSTGKTTFLAGLAHVGPVLIVNAEAGLKQTPLRKLGIPTDQIITPQEPVRSFEDLETIIEDLRDRLARDPGCVAGVCVDSMTEIETIVIGNIVAEEVRKASRRGIERDPFTVETGDWTQNAARMRRLIRSLRDLPCHVGFSALARRDQDEEGVVMYRPALTPRISNEIIAAVDICLAVQPPVIHRNTTTYWGYTRRVVKYQGKDRFRILPLRMPRPSMDRIVSYLSGQLNVTTDPEVAAFRKIREGE